MSSFTRETLDQLRAEYKALEDNEPSPGTPDHISWMAEMERFTEIIEALAESRGIVLQ